MVRNRNAHVTPHHSSYGPRINTAQKELMVEFLENHPEMANSALGIRADDRRRLWKELTMILNEDGLGATKTTDGWRDSWCEIKSYVKKKTAAILSTIDSSGGKIARGPLLHPLEERISALIWDSGVQAGHMIRLSSSESYDVLSETDSSQANLTPRHCDLSPQEDIQAVALSDISPEHSNSNIVLVAGSDTRVNASVNRGLSKSTSELITVKMEVPDITYTTTTTAPAQAATEEITPDRGPVNSRKRHLPPETESQQKPRVVTDEAATVQSRSPKRHVAIVEDVVQKRSSEDELASAQLRSAVAMERLADSVYQLVEHQRHILKVQTELEEKRLKLMEERTQTEEKKVSIFQQAVLSFVSFFKK